MYTLSFSPNWNYVRDNLSLYLTSSEEAERKIGKIFSDFSTNSERNNAFETSKFVPGSTTREIEFIRKEITQVLENSTTTRPSFNEVTSLINNKLEDLSAKQIITDAKINYLDITSSSMSDLEIDIEIACRSSSNFILYFNKSCE